MLASLVGVVLNVEASLKGSIPPCSSSMGWQCLLLNLAWDQEKGRVRWGFVEAFKACRDLPRPLGLLRSPKASEGHYKVLHNPLKAF